MDGILVPHLTPPPTHRQGRIKRIKRIERETKAKVSYNVNIFLAAQARAKESQHVAEAEARPARSAEGEKRLARFKIGTSAAARRRRGSRRFGHAVGNKSAMLPHTYTLLLSAPPSPQMAAGEPAGGIQSVMGKS